MRYLLWTLQVLLALVFVLSGVLKLVLPAHQLTAQFPMLPVAFIRFVGVAEGLGAIGLILPSLLRIRPALTPAAAVGLTIIMAGAVAYTLVIGGGAAAAIPFALGAAAALVAYGRSRLLPIPERGAGAPSRAAGVAGSEKRSA